MIKACARLIFGNHYIKMCNLLYEISSRETLHLPKVHSWRRAPAQGSGQACRTDCSFVLPEKCGPGDTGLDEYSMTNPGNTLRREEFARVPLQESRRFMVESLVASGAPDWAAAEQADMMLEADRQGHYKHGIRSLELYVKDILQFNCNPMAVPVVIKETPATAWVDAMGGLGAPVGSYCMNLAVWKARDAGVGWVVAKHCNHFGLGGWYTAMAMEQGMIGMCLTNGPPEMVPTRSKEAALASSTIAAAAPGALRDSFDLSMDMTATSMDYIENKRQRNEPLQYGFALDATGAITTDPNEAFKEGKLCPLGGEEETSGYKGYALALLFDILCGVCSGAKSGPHIPPRIQRGVGIHPHMGQCFIALNPNAFSPGFDSRLTNLLNSIRDLSPANSHRRVLIPGDKEKAATTKADSDMVVTYDKKQIESCLTLSKSLGVRELSYVSGSFP